MTKRASTTAETGAGVFIDPQALNSDPRWTQMSWEARGMALALMGMPMDEKFDGTLPPETDAWRNALGLPSARVMISVRDRSMEMRGSRAVNELDQAWAVWLGELMLWFRPIDDAFLAEHPQWERHKGRWWHPALETQEHLEAKGKSRKARARKQETADTLSKPVKPKRKPAKSRTVSQAIEPDLDYPPIRLAGSKLRQCWDEPMSSELRADLWEAGVRALGGNEKTARSLLGSLIKEFGEVPVAEAVAKLAVRASRPADPAAFLRKQVAIQAGVDPKAQKARNKRASVAL